MWNWWEYWWQVCKSSTHLTKATAEKLCEFLVEGNPLWEMVFAAGQWEKIHLFETIITQVQGQMDYLEVSRSPSAGSIIQGWPSRETGEFPPRHGATNSPCDGWQMDYHHEFLTEWGPRMPPWELQIAVLSVQAKLVENTLKNGIKDFFQSILKNRITEQPRYGYMSKNQWGLYEGKSYVPDVS